METKSRYEVIADLENQKRNLIRERDSFDATVLMKKKHIKTLERNLEDQRDELKEFEANISNAKATIQDLIASIDDSLKRFSDVSNSQKK